MKVRLSITVEIDPVAWELNYGVTGAAAIREDVKQYCEGIITEQLAETGVAA